MPGKPDKIYRIRVRTLDGKPRDAKDINKLKSNQLGMPHLDIVGTSVASEFIICASKDTHVEQVRSKLQAAGLEGIDDGDTAIAATAAPKPAQQQPRQGGFQPQRGTQAPRGGGQHRAQQGVRSVWQRSRQLQQNASTWLRMLGIPMGSRSLTAKQLA